MIREGWRELCRPGLMMDLKRMRALEGSGMAAASQPHSGMSHRESWRKVYHGEESQALHLVVHHEEGQME